MLQVYSVPLTPKGHLHVDFFSDRSDGQWTPRSVAVTCVLACKGPLDKSRLAAYLAERNHLVPHFRDAPKLIVTDTPPTIAIPSGIEVLLYGHGRPIEGRGAVGPLSANFPLRK